MTPLDKVAFLLDVVNSLLDNNFLEGVLGNISDVRHRTQTLT